MILPLIICFWVDVTNILVAKTRVKIKRKGISTEGIDNLALPTPCCFVSQSLAFNIWQREAGNDSLRGREVKKGVVSKKFMFRFISHYRWDSFNYLHWFKKHEVSVLANDFFIVFMKCLYDIKRAINAKETYRCMQARLGPAFSRLHLSSILTSR